MRKACMAGISVLIGISMLAGCGKSLDADTDTVYVQKNGTVLSVDVETLDKGLCDGCRFHIYRGAWKECGQTGKSVCEGRYGNT